MVQCIAGSLCVVPTYAERGALLDCIVRRNEACASVSIISQPAMGKP